MNSRLKTSNSRVTNLIPSVRALSHIAIVASMSIAGATALAAGGQSGSASGTTSGTSSDMSSSTASESMSETARQADQPQSQQGMKQADKQTISKVQQALKDKGHYQGQVDGKWDSESRAALRDFQQSQNIEVSGQLDSQTLSALGVQMGTEDTRSPASAPESQEQQMQQSPTDQPAEDIERQEEQTDQGSGY